MKELPEAEWPLPDFADDEAAARYFETHSLATIWDKLESVPALKLPLAQSRKIRERHVRRKTAISIRLQPDQITAAKKIADRKSIGYQTQLRLWIAEGIDRESRRGK